MLLLAAVPAFCVFFLVASVAPLRCKDTDPRTGKFCQVSLTSPSVPVLRPLAHWVAIFSILIFDSPRFCNSYIEATRWYSSRQSCLISTIYQVEGLSRRTTRSTSSAQRAWTERKSSMSFLERLFRLPCLPRCDSAGFKPTPRFELPHGQSCLIRAVFLHEPGTGLI